MDKVFLMFSLKFVDPFLYRVPEIFTQTRKIHPPFY